MERLTTDKKTSEMNMTELALNSCYVKNGEAWYRDYDTDISIRNLARELYKNIDIKMPEDDEEFDETVFEDLEYGFNTDIGLLALFYRNLWAMAELREKLKKYEDLEEQGLLLRLPCKVGDVVYINLPSWSGKFAGTQPHQITNILISQNKKGKWTKKYRAMLLYNGKTIDRQENFEFDEIGETVFLTKEEAEAKLKELGGRL